jgi:excisionase family DNA binding protein
MSRDGETLQMPQGTARPKANQVDRQDPQHGENDVEELYAKLQEAEAKLIGPDGKSEVLPNKVNSFLHRLLEDLRAGYSITILQNKAQFTTIEASRFLGMSRQFLVELLKKGEIPFHMVGTHRRMYARDVLAYKARRDASRRKTLNDLARAEYSEGMYDQVPDDFSSGQ